MKLKIKVTKDILERSKMCNGKSSILDGVDGLGANCAIALAVRDIFPLAWIADEYIDLFYFKTPDLDVEVKLPPKAICFIEDFDRATPEERINMPEIEFEIHIPDKAIEQINIDEIKPLLKGHPTLELVDAT